MRLLVLYEELAWYFINCLNFLCENHDCEVLIICKKPNAVAPFKFKLVHPKIKITEREGLSEDALNDLAKKFMPDALILGGWIFKPYLKIVKNVSAKYSFIYFDNQWIGSLKQRLGSLYFKMFIKPLIKYAFVPGERQSKFARHLGFKDSEIITGSYCCDHDLFNGFYNAAVDAKENAFPRRLLFAGRYVKEKGVEDLWHAFIELLAASPSEWELWCLGKGEIEPVQHEKIKHLGFMQAEEMIDIVKNTGVFVLPSTFEPWGVVAHEFAAAGFPLICSDKVGAADVFLHEGENGYIVKAGDKSDLKKKLKKVMTMSDKELMIMGKKSNELASRIKPAIWASNLINACK